MFKKTLQKIIESNFYLAKVFYASRMSRLKKNIASGKIKPILMGIELTNECPFSCVMCVRTYGMKRPLGHIDEDLFKKIIDEYVKYNPEGAKNSELIMTHFGESLLHPNFSKLIKYAVDSGCGDILFSLNPLLLTPAIQRRLIDSGVHRIHFSLDGHDDKSFEKIRGVKNAYERSKKNLLDFIKLVKSERRNIYLRLGMVDFDLNKESIDKMRAYWERVGLDEVWVKPAIAWSGSVKEVNNIIKFTPKISQRLVPTCMLPFHGVTVTYDGKVVACCADHDDMLVLGDLKNQSIKEVFSGANYEKLRDEFISGKVKNPLCGSCSELGITYK